MTAMLSGVIGRNNPFRADYFVNSMRELSSAFINASVD
jgi:hypothetical protein